MSPDTTRRFWRRRAAHLLLLVGLAFAASQLLSALPRDQQLVFRFPNKASVSRLEATWQDESGATLGGVTLNFPAGRRYSVRHRVELANGTYEFHVELEFLNGDGSQAGARSKTKLRRRVTLRGGETPISL